MATEEEIYQLTLQVAGEAEAKRLADQLKQLDRDIAAEKEQLGDLAMQLKAGAIAHEKFAILARYSAGSIAEMTAQADAARASLAAVGPQLDAIGRGAQASGHKLLQMGNLFDDLQYVPEQGLRPIINNVIQMAPALGIAMIAVQALWKSWEPLMESFGMNRTMTQAEQMGELAKKTEKTAEETAKLLKYEKERKNIAAQAADPKAVGDFQKRINEAVVEGPKAEIAKGIDADFGDRIKAMADVALGDIPDAQKDAGKLASYIDERRSRVDDGSLDPSTRSRAASELAGAKEALDKLNAAYADARDRFLADPKNSQAIGEAAGRNPGKYGPGGAKFAAAMVLAQPGNQQTPEDKAFVQRQSEAYKRRKADEKRDADDFEEEAQKVYRQHMEARKQAVESQSFIGKKTKDLDEFERYAAEDYNEKLGKLHPPDPKDPRADPDAKVRRSRSRAPADGSLEDAMKLWAMRAMKAGASAVGVREMMGKQGFSMGAADKAAREGQEQLLKDWIEAPAGKHGLRNSEVIDAAGLADSVQSGVGGDTLKEQLVEQRRMVAALNTLVRAKNANAGGAIAFGADGNLGSGD